VTFVPIDDAEKDRRRLRGRRAGADQPCEYDAELLDIYLLKGSQGKGYGSALTLVCVERFLDPGMTSMLVGPRDNPTGSSTTLWVAAWCGSACSRSAGEN
jgi:GNAT superfamily N-acetyltransferase